MWESGAVCQIPKGRWEEWETWGLVFHSFHGPVISTAPVRALHRASQAPMDQRKRGGGNGDSVLQARNSRALAAIILSANLVSLMAPASRSSCFSVIPSLR